MKADLTLPGIPILCLYAAPLVAAVGLVLLWRGLFRRRKGDAPHCRRCGYNLTGLASDRCPECGNDLSARNIVRGEGGRSVLTFCVGLLLMASAIALCLPVARQVDWYVRAPAFYVMWDMRSGQPVRMRRAWTEMARRLGARELSAAQRGRWIDFCLEEQQRGTQSRTNAADTWVMASINHLASEFGARKISAAQREAFLSHMVGTNLRVRPRVMVGDPVPFELEVWSCAPNAPTPLSCRYQMSMVDMGDDPRWDYRSWMGTARFGPRRLMDAASAPRAGRNPITVYLYWELIDPDGKRLDRRRFQCTSGFEAFAVEPPGFFTKVKANDATSALSDLIDVRELIYGGMGELSANFAVHPTPVPIAFDVTLRAGDREVPLGVLCRNRSLKNDRVLSKNAFVHCDLPAMTHCDLVFRGSSRAVRTTVDQYEYWDGELIVHDVPLRRLRNLNLPEALTQAGP